MPRKTGTLLGLSLAAALFATSAVAQTPAANKAAASAPSARQTELAHRYILAIHMDKMMDGMMKNVLPAMMAQMPKNPNLTDEQQKALLEATTEVTTRMMGRMMTQLEPIMADTFTEKELSDLVAFYEGPTGQSLIAKSPQMAARMAPLMAGLIPEMQAEMRAKVCARIDCTGADKAAAPKPS